MRYRRWRPGENCPVVVGGPRLGMVVPELADPGALGAFIEGLGTRGLTILATGLFYDAALELATLDPGRIVKVSPLGG